MKLCRVAKKIHLSSKRGAQFHLRDGSVVIIPTPRCRSTQSFYRAAEMTRHPFEFEGDVTQLTCKRCIHIATNHSSK